MKITNNVMSSQTPPVKEETSAPPALFFQPPMQSQPGNIPLSNAVIENTDQVKVFPMVEDTPHQGHSRTSSNTSLVDSNGNDTIIFISKVSF